MGINNSDLRRFLNYDGHKHTAQADEYDDREDRVARREAAVLISLRCVGWDARVTEMERAGASPELVKAWREVLRELLKTAREWSR